MVGFGATKLASFVIAGAKEDAGQDESFANLWKELAAVFVGKTYVELKWQTHVRHRI